MNFIFQKLQLLKNCSHQIPPFRNISRTSISSWNYISPEQCRYSFSRPMCKLSKLLVFQLIWNGNNPETNLDYCFPLVISSSLSSWKSFNSSVNSFRIFCESYPKLRTWSSFFYREIPKQKNKPEIISLIKSCKGNSKEYYPQKITLFMFVLAFQHA